MAETAALYTMISDDLSQIHGIGPPMAPGLMVGLVLENRQREPYQLEFL
jgi:hypothetical protein